MNLLERYTVWYDQQCPSIKATIVFLGIAGVIGSIVGLIIGAVHLLALMAEALGAWSIFALVFLGFWLKIYYDIKYGD